MFSVQVFFYFNLKQFVTINLLQISGERIPGFWALIRDTLFIFCRVWFYFLRTLSNSEGK